MKERGKAVETYDANYFSDYNYSSSDRPCKKHPSSSSVGICAYCLKDRLIKLVCSDCGEQRLSSCSCSEISSNPNSCSVEIGSVGRVSFLIENDRTETQHSHSKPQNGDRSEEVVMLKRSSSSCVDVKRSGFWRFGTLFRKKRGKGCERSVGGLDDKSDLWVFDYMRMSRSRSLCGFRGGVLNDPDEGSDFAFSSAKISDVNGGIILDSERQSGSSESETRKSGSKRVLDSENCLKTVKRGSLWEHDSAANVATRSVFPVKESDFNAMDDSGFIELKLDLSSESKPEFSAPKMCDLSDSYFGSLRGGIGVGHHECGIGDGFYSSGGSCRITVNDTGIKKGRKGQKLVIFRWFAS
ncbi:hypothetical protein F0562_033079 [Nyssa sinensis]|uniref:Uncharacterized protein n=1 Tax=Nyssa sinensis TaxID=561372 RepID=A0A5J5AR18_9ASTE|nr:hypothetical protein F0562_033079 [Nyssa sinensis]